MLDGIRSVILDTIRTSFSYSRNPKVTPLLLLDLTVKRGHYFRVAVSYRFQLLPNVYVCTVTVFSDKVDA